MRSLYRIHDIWADLHLLWRVLILLSLLALSFLVLYGPVRGQYQSWKGSNTISDAKLALAAGDLLKARNLSFQTLRGDEKDAEALSILLRSTTSLNDPTAVDTAVAMLQDARTSEEDCHLAWTYLCKSGPTFYLVGLWSVFPENFKEQEIYYLPFIDRLLFDRIPLTALDVIESLPSPHSTELAYRRLTILSRTAVDRDFSQYHRELLVQIGREPSSFPRLLESIDEIPQEELSPKIFEFLRNEVDLIEHLSVENRFRFYRCVIAADQGVSGTLFKEVLRRYKKNEPVQLAQWYLQMNRPEDAAECISLENPATNPKIYRIQIEILKATSQTTKLLSFLDNSPKGIPSWERFLLKSHSLKHNKNQKAVSRTSGKALKAAIESPDTSALIVLAQGAEDFGFEDLALDAWTNAIARATGPLPLSESIPYVISDLSAQGREDELYSVLNAFHFIETSNHIIQVQRLYLACLTGRAEPRTVIEEIKPMQMQFPDETALRCILAIALVISGDTAEANILTDNIGVDWFATEPAYRAIRGVILAKTGEVEEARIFFEDFPWDKLLPSERRVFSGLIDDEL